MGLVAHSGRLRTRRRARLPTRANQTSLEAIYKDAESVWHRYFLAEQPKNTYVYLQCDLIDGSHTAGKLVWYNTDLEDHPDRELVLSDPITTVGLNGDSWGHNDTLAILPAREIRQILVTYVKVPEPAPGGEDSNRQEQETKPPDAPR